MTDHEVQRIAEMSARKVLSELLLVAGVNANDPDSLIEFQKTIAFAAKMRESASLVQRYSLKTLVVTALTGLLGWIGLALFGNFPR